MFIRMMSILRSRISWVAIAVVVIAAAVTLGCAGEEQAYFSEPKVQMKGANCLADSLAKFDEFFEGNVTEGDIHVFWDCFDTTITSIERYMEGSAQNGNYKSQDLRQFVAKYFLKSNKPDGIVINDILLDELMEVKRQFLGGSRHILTQDEINKTHRIIKEFRALTVRIHPSIALILQDNKGVEPTHQEVSRAIANITYVIERLGDLLAVEQNAYSLDRFVRLITELNKIVGRKGAEPRAEWLKYIPAFQELKHSFLLTSKTHVEQEEWRILSRLVSQGFALYFRYKHFFTIKTVLNPSTVAEIPKAFDGVYAILNEALQRRQSKSFSTAEFTEVIDALDRNGLLPGVLPKATMINLWTVVVDRLLAPKKVNVEDGLGEEELLYGRSIWNGWLVAQNFILGQKVDESHEEIENLKKFLDLPWPFIQDEEKRLVFKGPGPGTSDLASATDINWMRSVFNLLAKGYSAGDKLTEDQLKAAISDVKPLLVLFGLISKDSSENFHSTLFLQANLFLPHSDGDGTISVHEVVEFVFYALKGAHSSDLFVKELSSHCDTTQATIEAGCFREGIKFLFSDRVAHLPHMVEYANTLKKNKKDWKEFVEDLESATRPKGQSKSEPIAKADVGEMFVLMQFIETIMFIYDQDLSGELNLQEALLALPLFEARLADLSGFDDPEEIRTLFTFLLKYGEPPDMKNPISILRYLHWKFNKKKWKLETNRGTIVKILSSISGS